MVARQMKPGSYTTEERERRDFKVLDFVDRFIAANGYSPSIDEIRDDLKDYKGDPSSTSVVASILRRLRYYEYITSADGVRRSIVVTPAGRVWLAHKREGVTE